MNSVEHAAARIADLFVKIRRRREEGGTNVSSNFSRELLSAEPISAFPAKKFST